MTKRELCAWLLAAFMFGSASCEAPSAPRISSSSHYSARRCWR